MVLREEVEEIMSCGVVKERIMKKWDCKMVVEERKYMKKLEEIEGLVGVREKEKGEIVWMKMEKKG